MRTNGIDILLINPIEFFKNFLGYSDLTENYYSEIHLLYWRSIAYNIFEFEVCNVFVNVAFLGKNFRGGKIEKLTIRKTNTVSRLINFLINIFNTKTGLKDLSEFSELLLNNIFSFEYLSLTLKTNSFL